MVDPTIQAQVQAAVITKVGRLPLADHLGSDEDMRAVIQSLSDICQTLSDRIAVLEAKQGIIAK